MTNKNALSHKRLKELLDYNYDFGIFIWKIPRARKIKIGQMAGCTLIDRNGHKRISITLDKKIYYAHHLAWFYHYGKWPKKEIDHRDGNELNNRFYNLREADDYVSNQNKGTPKNNILGIKGVWYNKKKKKYLARIQAFKKNYWLGYFDTAEEAQAAYAKASLKYHGEYGRAA